MTDFSTMDSQFVPDASDDEQLLDRFRQWLRETREQAEQLDQQSDSNDALEEPEPLSVGLYRVVEEFSALRQELKIQTRGSRSLEEAIGAVLPLLRDSVETVRELRDRKPSAMDNAPVLSAPSPAASHGQLQSLALALAELDEALDRGRRQVERSAEMLNGDAWAAVADQLDAIYARQSWLARRAGRRFYEELQEVAELSRENRERDPLLAALIDGYGLIQQRLTRMLAKEDIYRIQTVGQVVDPEQMIVVEAVASDGPAGLVVDETRRGYTWKGRVLRCAEVRASRGSSLESSSRDL